MPTANGEHPTRSRRNALFSTDVGKRVNRFAGLTRAKGADDR
jgi:hypothetical protein